MDIDPVVELVQVVVDGMLPSLNERLPAAIVEGGVDPYAELATGKDDVGFAHVKFSLTKLTGLSSLVIGRLTVLSAGPDEENPRAISGTLGLLGHLDARLDAKMKGRARSPFAKAGFDGRVRMTGLTLSAIGTFTAVGTPSGMQLETVKLDATSVDYDRLKAKVHGLGPLNELLRPVEQTALRTFKKEIRGAISRKVTRILGNVLRDQIAASSPAPAT
ncbi:MAG: hypothetical protein KC620_08045 [Myxococcales bacterium]|nr:hypothetical protein [Myxococcales bacterium]